MLRLAAKPVFRTMLTNSPAGAQEEVLAEMVAGRSDELNRLKDFMQELESIVVRRAARTKPAGRPQCRCDSLGMT